MRRVGFSVRDRAVRCGACSLPLWVWPVWDGELCLAGGGSRAWPHGPARKASHPPPPPPLEHSSTAGQHVRHDTARARAHSHHQSSPNLQLSVLSPSPARPTRHGGRPLSVCGPPFSLLFFTLLFFSDLGYDQLPHTTSAMRSLAWNPRIIHANHLPRHSTRRQGLFSVLVSSSHWRVGPPMRPAHMAATRPWCRALVPLPLTVGVRRTGTRGVQVAAHGCGIRCRSFRARSREMDGDLWLRACAAGSCRAPATPILWC